MQQDPLEVEFCDLCGASVPAVDAASGAAIRHQGKTIGACCLGVLRGRGAGAGDRGAVAGRDGRFLTIGIVLLAAVAAATIFLESRISNADAANRASQAQLIEAQRSDSDVLQAVGMATDGMARRADHDGLRERLDTVLAEHGRLAEALEAQVTKLQQEQARIAAGLQNVAERTVDTRPLFDDLRGQLLQQGGTLADLLAAARARPAAAPEVPVAAPVQPPEAGGEALSPELSAAVAKLASSEPAVRFEAVDALLRAKNAAVVERLLPLARDPDSFVRRLTVEGLRDWKTTAVVEVLLAGLEDADENVRETAWRSLKEVTGQKFPFETLATKDARSRAVQRWTEWWEKNKASFGS